MTAAAPSGVVTFLFTDVAGSTGRWEKDADAMRAALAAHDEALRSAIEGHGGFMFKHTADGVCAAFGSPKAAVDAAAATEPVGVLLWMRTTALSSGAVSVWWGCAGLGIRQ
jgi:class 3 adenylate cyclase